MLKKLMGLLAAVFLALHGFAHTVGVLGSWGLIETRDAGWETTLLDGRVDVGTFGMYVLGAIWVVPLLGFAAVAYGLARRRPWFVPLAVPVTALSLALSALAWPQAAVGVFVDVAILSLLALAAVARRTNLASPPGRRPAPTHASTKGAS